jgi:hypothetical protein
MYCNAKHAVKCYECFPNDATARATMFVVGFTGTRQGMSEQQQQRVRAWLFTRLPIGEFHHGDCVGADHEAACIAEELGIVTVAHPSLHTPMRAFHKSTRVLPPKPPLVRNRDIVDVCSFLLVAPRLPREELRSGTWATFRYAKSIGRPREVIER